MLTNTLFKVTLLETCFGSFGSYALNINVLRTENVDPTNLNIFTK